MTASWLKEHGPFAGGAYFEDIKFVSQARDGFISASRSSSLLVQELIEFDRQMEALQKQLKHYLTTEVRGMEEGHGSGATSPSTFSFEPLPALRTCAI